MKICFTFYGDPVSKARPRVTRHGTYTPQKTKSAEEEIAWQAKAVMKGSPVEGPVRLTIVFQMKHNGKKRTPASPHIQRPDLDNLIKLVKDSLNGIVYKDDCQVCEIEAAKFWCEFQPKTVVTVESV